MDNLIDDKVTELYNLIMDKPLKILSIFNNFFGENKVDMQGFMGIDEFKSWLKSMSIQLYLNSQLLDLPKEEYDTYKKYSLYDIKDTKILNTILNYICSADVIRSLGVCKFISGFILVHFPHIKVTNEYNRFVYINHLYAKVAISFDGRLVENFSLNRSEYSYLQFSNNYMHSHINSIPKNDFTIFNTPCTGSGPINNTMNNLKIEFNLDLWELFCLELSKFVEVESVSGIPYHKLESIRDLRFSPQPTIFKVVNNSVEFNLAPKIFKGFIPYFIRQKRLKFNYFNGSYSLSMPFVKYMVVVSNEFIKWYNKEYENKKLLDTYRGLLYNGILRECVIADNKIFYIRDINPESYERYNGMPVCVFKGKEITLNIKDNSKEKMENKSVILNINISLYILSKILYVINYKYGRSEKRNSEGNKPSEKVKYL